MSGDLNTRPSGAPLTGWARRHWRLLTLAATVLVVIFDRSLRDALVGILLGLVALAVVLIVLGVILAGLGLRMARRHPIFDMLAGAWLYRRYEYRQEQRRQRETIDARSWPPPQYPRAWPPPTHPAGQPD